jgi:hypothetical protein
MSNYLLVVGNSAALTAQDTFWQTRLTGQGHTVTVADDGDAIPGALETTFHAVIMSNTANINQIGTKYDATTRGVFSVGPYPHSKYTTQASPSNSTTGTTLFVLASGGDPIVPTGSGTSPTYLTATAIHTYIDNGGGTSFGAGATFMLASRNDLLTRIAGSRYDAGGTMTASTTAPSRRVRLGFTDMTLLNATGLGWVDNAVTWVTTTLANQAPTANAGADQAVASNVTVTLDGSHSSDPDGTISTYTWSQTSGTAVTLTGNGTAHPTFTSPASLTGATLIFSLTVTDNQGASSASPDTVTITVAQRASIKYRHTGAWIVKPVKTHVAGSWKN